MKKIILLLIFFLLSTIVTDLNGNCRCFKAPLDLVFVIDRSASMVDEIYEVKSQLQKMMALIKKQNPRLRVGVVSYESTAEMVDLTEDSQKVAKFLQDIAVAGGIEIVDKALEAAIDKMTWRPNAQKVIILIGDEPPNNYSDRGRFVRGELRSYEMAHKARQKGIIVHTISTIQMGVNMNSLSPAQRQEWYALSREYHQMNRLQRTNPQQYARKRQEWYRKFNEFYRRVSQAQNPGTQAQTIPSFEKIAQKGGGKSIALGSTKKLISTLLYFSTGMRFDLQKAGTKTQAPPAGIFTLGQISHLGDWNPPRDFPGLMEAASKNLNITGRSQPFKIDLYDDTLYQYPFLYLTGHKSFSFGSSQIERLQKHLQRGGLLFIDCCCGREAFDRSVRSLCRSLFPQNPLKKISGSHSLYLNPFRMEEVRVAKIPMESGMEKIRDYLEGVNYKGRLVIIYSSKCVGCGIEGTGGGPPCGIADEDAAKVFQNILFYALTE